VPKILITGSEGFVGKETVRQLLDQGLDVHTLDIRGEGKKHFKADINSQEAREFISNLMPEVIIHLAAQVDVQYSLNNPFSDMTSNISGTLNILDAGIKGGVKEFIFVGSGGAIYSSDNAMPVTEDGKLLPVSPYGVSKLAAENYVRVIAELNNVGWTSLALSNCYGKVSTHPRGVIFEFFRKIDSGESPVINGITVTRDFIHVSDVASAIKASIGNPTNCRLNISSNTEISLGELFDKIAQILSSGVKPIVNPPREGDVLRSRLDNSKAFKMLKWKPKVGIDEGLKENLGIDGRTSF
jgi:UDP-glucose 4-epimerase